MLRLEDEISAQALDDVLRHRYPAQDHNPSVGLVIARQTQLRFRNLPSKSVTYNQHAELDQHVQTARDEVENFLIRLVPLGRVELLLIHNSVQLSRKVFDLVLDILPELDELLEEEDQENTS